MTGMILGMDRIHHVSLDEQGRLTVPAATRARMALRPGAPLVLVETTGGLLVLAREQLKARVQEDLAGPSLVDELLDERRRAAADEGD